MRWLGVYRTISVRVDSPNLGLSYFNFFEGAPVKKHPVFLESFSGAVCKETFPSPWLPQFFLYDSAIDIDEQILCFCVDS